MSRRSALVPHLFVPSGRRTYGHRICVVCDSLERDSVHRVREPPPEAAELDRRKTGESDGSDNGTTVD